MIRDIFLAVAVLSVGCGGTALGPPPDGGTDSGSGSDGARDGGPDVTPTDTGTPWSPVCPEAEPTVGSPCSISVPKDSQPVVCEYGTLQYDPSCDAVYQCQDGVWGKSPSFGGSCQPDGPNSASCPATYADIQAVEAGTCPEAGLRCEYPDAVCLCTLGFGVEVIDGGTTWSCNPGPGCPMPRPRLGSSCSASNLSCTYETCEFAEECQDGYWQAEFEACAGVGGSP